MSLPWPVVGALMLLVLPPLAALCVLLTGPVAGLIGRRQREEAQVVRAPVLVAGVALLVETCLALALRHTPEIGRELRVAVGGGVFWLDCYAVSSIVGLSVAVLVAVLAAEAARPMDRPVNGAQVASVLLLWAAHVALLASGNLRTVAAATALTGVAVGAALLVVAWREVRPVRVGLTVAAVLGPVCVWLLLGGLRRLPVGADLDATQTALRTMDPRLAQAALGRLWVAGVALIPAAMLLLILAGERRHGRGAESLAALLAVGVAGALPAFLRITLAGFPAGSPVQALAWLTPRVAAVAVTVGVLALGAAQAAPVGPWRRAALLAVAAVCAVAWAMVSFTRAGAGGALLHAGVVGALLPFSVMAAAAAERGAPSPFHTVSPAFYDAGWVLLIAAWWPLGWAPAAGGRGFGAYAAGGALLGVLFILTGVRLLAQLLRARATTLPGVPLPWAPTSGGRGPAVRALALTIALLVVALLVGTLWAAGAADLSFPLP